MHDRTIYKMEGGLKEKIPPGKKVVCDRVYRDKKGNDNHELFLPNIGDPKELFKFKSRLRARHESLNGRLKAFSILENTFRHDPENHVYAFEAVIVLVQYTMDRGHPIFDAHSFEVEDKPNESDEPSAKRQRREEEHQDSESDSSDDSTLL